MKRPVRLPHSSEFGMLLDVGSYARRGPQRPTRLSPSQVAHISRTVRRVPEVVVKVLPKHPNTAKGAGAHLDYIGRYGKLELETDDGDRVSGRDVGRRLAKDWKLNLDELRPPRGMAIQDREPPKLVHKLVFSMPADTPAVGLLAATRDFLREEFGGKHRYAFVLHEDRPQPHVHVVVRARSRDGERLNIRKETLRDWRQGFARHLNEHGIAANATERAVRGQARTPKADPIYRAQRRGNSTHMQERVYAVASELAKGKLVVESGQAQLLRTRREVTDGWRAVADMLRGDRQHELASRVDQFVGRMPPPLTDKQWILFSMLNKIHNPASGIIPAAPSVPDSSQVRSR